MIFVLRILNIAFSIYLIIFRSRLVTQDVKFKQGCVYAVILSVGTPIGIVLGVAVEAQLTGPTLLLVTAVIQVILNSYQSS